MGWRRGVVHRGGGVETAHSFNHGWMLDREPSLYNGASSGDARARRLLEEVIRGGRWTLLPMAATQIEVNRGACRLGKQRVATPLGVDPGRLLFPEPCYFSMGQISGADIQGPGPQNRAGGVRPTASNGERGKGVSMWGASLCLVMLLGWRGLNPGYCLAP
jgi:hypothetical protein